MGPRAVCQGQLLYAMPKVVPLLPTEVGHALGGPSAKRRTPPRGGLICDTICFQWFTKAIFEAPGFTLSFKPALPAALLKRAPPILIDVMRRHLDAVFETVTVAALTFSLDLQVSTYLQ
jgi:hypothetical protein